jgi:hypothetical protein
LYELPFIGVQSFRANLPRAFRRGWPAEQNHGPVRRVASTVLHASAEGHQIKRKTTGDWMWSREAEFGIVRKSYRKTDLPGRAPCGLHDPILSIPRERGGTVDYPPQEDYLTRCARRAFLLGEGEGNHKLWIESRL